MTPEQFGHLLSVIREHRYPEKNTALVQISFKLGLRVQEIALLQIKDVAELGPDTSAQRSFNLKEILARTLLKAERTPISGRARK